MMGAAQTQSIIKQVKFDGGKINYKAWTKNEGEMHDTVKSWSVKTK